MTNNISIGKVNPFSVNINKLNITKASPSRYSPAHIHDLCEIYVNLTGNVSFIVENNIYAIQAGDIVITRPYEYHHCLYNSDHLHYWFLFSPHENSELFNFFLEAERGTNNLIRLPEDILDEFLGLCDKITRINPSHQISCLYVFFEIIYISNGLAKYNVQDENKNLPQNVKNINLYKRKLCVNQKYKRTCRNLLHQHYNP